MAADSGNSLLTSVNHNPDVLSCLANLSNDEVFTPPAVANAMLDLLPQELFKNPDAKFLDPVCKSGVFLREITKRLMAGLEKDFPEPQQRLDHILHNQVYGIAITELTSLIARRTLYCAKYATSPYAISKFENIDGNIRFKALRHTFDKNGKCVYCGAAQSQYEREEGLESHAYEFIHTDRPEEIFKDMKFDVIIGNPPYHLSDGGDTSERRRGGAIPIYHHFIDRAKLLNPKYISMITPSRWFTSGRGLDDFRVEMLNDTRIAKLIDYPITAECFPGVEIKGGISYFLWDRASEGKCEVTTIRNGKISKMKRSLNQYDNNIFIRFNESISILDKILYGNEKSFEKLVSAQTPFGLRTFVKGSNKASKDSIKIYQNGGMAYISRDAITKNIDMIDKYKIFVSRAYGAGEDFPHQILGKPLLASPPSCCTETYIAIGPFKDKNVTHNVITYIQTKFFRFLVSLIKVTQMAPASVYKFVPLQDFSKPWTDAELYAKYKLSQEEIDFIESMIKPMATGNAD